MLVKQAETLSESTSLTHEGVEYDALLFSAPLVAWTRYQLPQGELTAEQITALVTQMQACVVAPDAHLAIEIEQPTCMERVCLYVLRAVVAVSLKKKFTYYLISI